ncbi:hypothetical protein HMPREF1862_01343 [Varibaculum cambriense]|uniref:Uncharacterized protein n=1 Tax=Varibaculum cambriense TaxID=184870 RepID=A0AB34WYM3_9ACTO|nr:hypothetical protein HMPREF1862_01343 [Varibaculum cambriense]
MPGRYVHHEELFNPLLNRLMPMPLSLRSGGNMSGCQLVA